MSEINTHNRKTNKKITVVVIGFIHTHKYTQTHIQQKPISKHVTISINHLQQTNIFFYFIFFV